MYSGTRARSTHCTSVGGLLHDNNSKIQNWGKKKNPELGPVGNDVHGADMHVDVDKPLFERRNSKDGGAGSKSSHQHAPKSHYSSSSHNKMRSGEGSSSHKKDGSLANIRTDMPIASAMAK